MKHNKSKIEFTAKNKKSVITTFDGHSITSDAGLLLLREVEEKHKVIDQLSKCFLDYRDKRYVEHSIKHLLSQRIFGICAGYEDLNDHDHLRNDKLYSLISGKEETKDSISGKSTLNRLEKALSNNVSRYHKITTSKKAIANILVKLFIDAYDNPPKKIVLDVDATDSPLHGHQEERFFHGYYGEYCYLPLYITCNGFILLSKLRPAGIDASSGTKKELKRIIAIIKRYWPEVKILVRGDSGFCRDDIMSWCEKEKNVDFIFGIATNSRLVNKISPELEEMKKEYEKKGEAQRMFTEFRHQPLKKNWRKERRVIAKAEYLSKGENPRFIITSLRHNAKKAYEEIYCARGDMENRIKEQQLYLFAMRMSCHKINENQLRLWFSTIAYHFFHLLRTKYLKGTKMAKAQCNTLRLQLIKIGGVIKESCRRIHFSLSEGYSWKKYFLLAARALTIFDFGYT